MGEVAAGLVDGERRAGGEFQRSPQPTCTFNRAAVRKSRRKAYRGYGYENGTAEKKKNEIIIYYIIIIIRLYCREYFYFFFVVFFVRFCRDGVKKRRSPLVFPRATAAAAAADPVRYSLRIYRGI